MLLVVVPQSLFITQSYGRTRGQGEGRIEDRKTRESHESCTSVRDKMSSQVQSSQIQNGGRQSASFGAPRWRERSGGQNSAQPAPLWIAPSRGHTVRLDVRLDVLLDVLDHRGARSRASTSCLFQEVYCIRQCKTDPDRRRERSGACASSAPMGQGVRRVSWRPPAGRRRAASSTRGPSPMSFGVWGLTRARQSFLARQQWRLARRRQEWCSRVFLRHTPYIITHARARDIQVWRRLRRERQTGGGSSRGRCLQGVTGRTATARRRRQQRGSSTTMLEGDGRGGWRLGGLSG